MIVYTMVSGANTVSNGPTVNMNDVSVRPVSSPLGVAQATITGVCTIKLQGRVHPDAGWVDVATFNVSGFSTVTVFPFMRWSVSAVNGGTADLYIAVNCS